MGQHRCRVHIFVSDFFHSTALQHTACHLKAVIRSFELEFALTLVYKS